MKDLEWTFVDKSKWGDGPWQDEPDKTQWTDPETKLPCLIVRGPNGALCGYVGVDETHPWHAIGYGQSVTGGDRWEDAPEALIDVHGQLTFSAFCQENAEHGICHKVEPGDPDPVWWLGFDCAHLHDFTPKYPITQFRGDVYRDIDYVKKQCRELAEQLAKVAKGK